MKLVDNPKKDRLNKRMLVKRVSSSKHYLVLDSRQASVLCITIIMLFYCNYCF
jgi:hypothetical protein